MNDIKIILGDCIEVMQKIPANSIDMIFTDPPYGHNNNDGDLISNIEKALGKKRVKEEKERPILNDGPEANTLFKNMLLEAERILKPGCCCCCCGGGGGPDPQFARWSLWMDKLFNFKQMVVWDKGKMGMGWHYHRSYETVLVADKKGGKPSWYDSSHKIENIIRPGDYGIRKIIPNKRQHPTEKPVELPMHFIKLHSKPGDTILDPFCGSGSTGIAAVRMGRKFIGIELDPHWHAHATAKINRAIDQKKSSIERFF